MISAKESETYARNWLEKTKGYDIILRTDRSRGPFDLIALSSKPNAKPILFIQQKTSEGDVIKVKPDEKNSLLFWAQKMPQFVNLKMLFIWFYKNDNQIIDLRDISRLKNENKPDEYWVSKWNPYQKEILN